MGTFQMESRRKSDGLQEVKFVPSGGNKTSFRESERTMHNGKGRDFESGMISKPSTANSAYDFRDGGFWTGRMKCGVCSAVTCFVLIFIAVLLGNSGHKVMEGTVAIYFRGGALQNTTNNPGIHFTMPFITEIERIKIRPRTDALAPITTVTKDGIQNTFRNVEVISDVNAMKVVALVRKYGLEFHKTLVFDRIFEEIRIFCAGHDIDEVYNKKFLEMVSEVTNRTKETIKKLGELELQFIISLFLNLTSLPTSQQTTKRLKYSGQQSWSQHSNSTQRQLKSKPRK